MIKTFTLSTSDGENVSMSTNSDGIAIFSMDLTEDWVTKTRSMSIGKAAAWSVDWSGITSGSGTLTLQISANGGISWATAVESDGTTDVTVTVTGTQTEPTIVAANKCNAIHYRWSYEDTDTAGTDAVVTIYMQVEE